MSFDRVLDLEGVHNFRDYGGYALPGGGRLKRGILWRSGQHADATGADLARIGALGLAHVHDLRGKAERSRQPCRRPEGFAATIHTFDEETTPRAVEEQVASAQAPHVAAASGPRRDAASTRENMRRSYAGMPFRPTLIAMIGNYLVTLAEGAEGPNLINCMAGKDRTGLSVALLHTALGVHPDDILADYLLTNTAGDAEARIAAGGRVVRAVAGADVDDEVIRLLMSVEPEYLDTAFAAIRERHGSLDAYLAEALGLDAARRESLRARLVE